MIIKPLKWYRSNTINSMVKAESIIGVYRIWTHFEAKGKWFWRLGFDTSKEEGTASSEEEAKAKAEEDYQRTIKSALSQ